MRLCFCWRRVLIRFRMVSTSTDRKSVGKITLVKKEQDICVDVDTINEQKKTKENRWMSEFQRTVVKYVKAVPRVYSEVYNRKGQRCSTWYLYLYSSTTRVQIPGTCTRTCTWRLSTCTCTWYLGICTCTCTRHLVLVLVLVLGAIFWIVVNKW